ncbi:MAG: DNA-binding protein [Candidatus Omnitrophica bacterium CG02_land_8_20_14_3_00__42_8]|nr:MAG: DNA-binding protein [Candidatus Omnitrophica bacterium CG02_land_8_20_14_3_00__42_8]PIW68677.1 MAG: DNA-binding protein [Candidatus Omnitrophica bacterium CG12_big_fil_rev_8_21_14_0_65_42_8]
MLSKRVKELRKQKGWTQQKLAENAGLAFNTITKIEQSLAEHPNLKTLLKLADAFGVSLDELVGRKTK